MQTSPKTYNYSGIIAVLGLLVLLVGLIVMLLLPGIRLVAWGILVLGVIFLAVAFILDFRQVSSALTGRRGRLGAGTTVMASIFIGITLVANAISIGNYQRFDLTSLAQFTLTTQTKEVLSKLETPVQVLAFFTPADPYGISSYAQSLLTEYQNYTDQLSVEYIDPDEHPDQARQYGIFEYQTIVFESENHRRAVFPMEIVERAEHAFTSAILEITGIVQKKVYFLVGHAEGNIDSTASNGYSRAKQGLLDNLYHVQTLDLGLARAIPEDTAALIIAGPQRSLGTDEVEIINNYLQNNGRVLMLINPDTPKEIQELLSNWGIDIEDGTVIDPSSYAAPSLDSPTVPRVRNSFGLSTTYFPGSTALIPQAGFEPKIAITESEEIPRVIWTSEDSEIEMLSLLRTSKDSWLEKDFDVLEDSEFNEGIDLEGPLNLSFLITTALPEESEGQPIDEADLLRFIVIGDSDFASNQHFYNGDNSDLFLNTVNVLATGIEVISIERKVLPFRRMVINQETANFINYTSIGLLPVLVLIAGGVIWWRRK